ILSATISGMQENGNNWITPSYPLFAYIAVLPTVSRACPPIIAPSHGFAALANAMSLGRWRGFFIMCSMIQLLTVTFLSTSTPSLPSLCWMSKQAGQAGRGSRQEGDGEQQPAEPVLDVETGEVLDAGVYFPHYAYFQRIRPGIQGD